MLSLQRPEARLAAPGNAFAGLFNRFSGFLNHHIQYLR